MVKSVDDLRRSCLFVVHDRRFVFLLQLAC